MVVTEDQSIPETQNLQNTTTETDSESDPDHEAQDNLQIQTLEIELSTNPANYNPHVQYIRALRKLGTEWAKDEASHASGPNAFPRIEKFYEHGSTLDVNSSSLDRIASHVASSYQKALEMLNARAQLKEQISRRDIPNSKRFQHFTTYLKFEQSSGDPAWVQGYKTLSLPPWVGELWLQYMLSLEHRHASGSGEEISAIFEMSLMSSFSSLDEYLN
ncbi:hypothetical protein LguiB_004705 [Lonicera macranthoides]